MRMRVVSAVAAGLLVLALPAVGTAATPVGPRAVPPTPVVEETLASGLDTPWDIAFLADGSALVSERATAMIKRVTPAGEVSDVGRVEGVVPGGEGGLLGLAVDPTPTGQAPYVYAYYTAADDNRIVRMPYDGSGLGEQQVLVRGIPKAGYHNGGRLAFGPDGMLYASTGDAGVPSRSQNPDSSGGKILRLTPDGRPAPGNPSGTMVWSLGHRNVQGLAWDSAGRMWASELGQDTWDELNLIEAGSNYGWPECEGPCDDSRYVNPKATWRPAEASPSGLAYAQDTVWMAALRGQRLWGVPIKDGELDGDPKAFFEDVHGRLRAIERAPDGSLWLATNGSGGRVLQLTLPN